MTKRIRLTVEWDGATSERAYGAMLKDDIEDGDETKGTRVVEVEHLTSYGYTPTPILKPRRSLFDRMLRLLRWLR